MANLTNSQEPGVFGSLEPEPLEKKTGAGAAWENNREPEPLEKKKSGAGAKFAGSTALYYSRNSRLTYPFNLSLWIRHLF